MDTTYLNAVEALEYNYQKGSRAFELDFDKTSDGVTVVFHGGFEKLINVPKGFTYADWTNYAKYPSPHNVTRMDLPIMVELFKKYPDTYLITDHKSNPVILQEIIDCFLSNDISLDRLVPQLYSFFDIRHVKKYSIKHKIFTIYGFQNAWIFRQPIIGDFLLKNTLRLYFLINPEVKILTMPISRYKQGYLNSLREEFDLKIYVHSAKDLEESQQLKEMGVDGIYIDFI